MNILLLSKSELSNIKILKTMPNDTKFNAYIIDKKQ